MTITWYTSCDYQLYALAPLSWFALYKFPKYGILWNIILLVFAVLFPVFNNKVLGHIHLYQLLYATNFRTLMQGWVWHYWSPTNYMQTYIMGILVAYVLRKYPKLNLGGRIGESLIWFGTVMSCLTILYWQKNFIDPGYQFDKFNGNEMPLYLLTHKIMFLPAYAWLVYACETGRGG